MEYTPKVQLSVSECDTVEFPVITPDVIVLNEINAFTPQELQMAPHELDDTMREHAVTELARIGIENSIQ
ncbi:MAG: hypothetical protein Q4B06_00120 [Candidatus Saccharibacteria bacterium]|nr:hypothetical protein [Candidatus Saccharibacteria bacterium]